jgi:hypothetical protein
MASLRDQWETVSRPFQLDDESITRSSPKRILFASKRQQSLLVALDHVQVLHLQLLSPTSSLSLADREIA